MAEAPWDTTPASDSQVEYAQLLVRRLHEEGADKWASLDTTQISGEIARLNVVRKRLGIPFKEMDGFVSLRQP